MCAISGFCFLFYPIEPKVWSSSWVSTSNIFKGSYIQLSLYIFGHWHNFHNFCPVWQQYSIKMKQSRWNWSAGFKLYFKELENHKMRRNYNQKHLGCFCCMFWVIVHLYCAINFAAFGWNWADSISLYTSELIRLLLSSVSSSINTSSPSLHVHAITLLHHVSDDVVCFG